MWSLFNILVIFVVFRALLISATLTTTAHAYPLDITDSDKIKDIITKFQLAMKDLLAIAGGEVRSSLMLAYQSADALVQSLNLTYQNQLQNTFIELDGQQRKAFQDTAATLVLLDKMTKERIYDATDPWRKSNDILAHLTVKTPLLSSYGPANIAPNKYKTADILIKLTGFNLCFDFPVNAPKRVIQEQEISAKSGECTGKSVTFLVPREFFPTPETQPETVRAALVMYYDNSRWYNRIKKVGLVSYSLMFNVLPNELGSLEYSYKVPTPKKVEPIPFEADLHTESSAEHNGEHHECFPLDEKGGWKYDFAHA